METLPDGSYRKSDGTIIPADRVGKLYKKAPLSRQAQTEREEEEDNELQEGQSSGVIDLNEG